MGGITGCLALADGAGPDTEWVGRATVRIAHRGPDDQGFFTDPDLALGFRRLAVIDPSPAGPPANSLGRWPLRDGLRRRNLQLRRAGPAAGGPRRPAARPV